MPAIAQPQRLRLKSEIDFIYEHGKKIYNQSVSIIFIFKGNEAELKYGVVATKRCGKAVDRNKARRRVREAIRKSQWAWNSGYHFLIFPRKSVLNVAYAKLVDELKALFERANIIEMQ